MSWHGALAELGQAAKEEFAFEAIHSPTITRPNYEAQVDPARPAYPLCGIFDEVYDEFNTGGTKTTRDGLSNTRVPSTNPTFSAPVCEFKFPPTQGDGIIIADLNRRFRILSVEFGMPTVWRLVLEEVGNIPAA